MWYNVSYHGIKKSMQCINVIITLTYNILKFLIAIDALAPKNPTNKLKFLKSHINTI